MLVIPFRHVQDFFALSSEEKYAILELVGDCKRVIEKTEKPDGYNIGFNVGAAAGQTVMHCHCHVIPRYAGDTESPSGGVECLFHINGTIKQNIKEQVTGSRPATNGGSP
jgi:diadenosine tetraphosphate (Ap4A) HIT family hydrolase